MKKRIKNFIIKILDIPIFSSLIIVFIGIVFPALIEALTSLCFLMLRYLDIDFIFEGLENVENTSAFNVINCGHPVVLIINLSAILASLLLLYLYKKFFSYKEFEGVLGFYNMREGLFYMLPFLVFLLLEFLLGTITGSSYKFGLIVLGFVPAFNEEIAFRGIVIPNIFRKCTSKVAIYGSFLTSSFLFGLVHATNILAGAEFSQTMFQVFYAFAIGALFAAIFIRCGNLWPMIIAHGVMDLIGYMTPDALENGATLTTEFSFNFYTIFLIVFCLMLLSYALWMIRPSQQYKIAVVWKLKWGYTYPRNNF